MTKALQGPETPASPPVLSTQGPLLVYPSPCVLPVVVLFNSSLLIVLLSSSRSSYFIKETAFAVRQPEEEAGSKQSLLSTQGSGLKEMKLPIGTGSQLREQRLYNTFYLMSECRL